ncbi:MULTISPECIES: hypothetical protein [Carnobacterium]|nr:MULTISPECIES: hypothetical protein [Carnobacterium]
MVDALEQTETTQVPVVNYEQVKSMYEELNRKTAENVLKPGMLVAVMS